jgi:protein polybromo-1
VPQKEPSPLLDKKIEELELKLADVEDGDEDLEDLDDDDEAPATPSMPLMQTPVTVDLDATAYTPSQVWSCTIDRRERGTTRPSNVRGTLWAPVEWPPSISLWPGHIHVQYFNRVLRMFYKSNIL